MLLRRINRNSENMKILTKKILLFLLFSSMIILSCKENNNRESVHRQYVNDTSVKKEDFIDKILIQFYPSFERASLILLDLSKNQQTFQRIGHKEYPNVSLDSPKSMTFQLDSLSYAYLKDIVFEQEDFGDRQDHVEDGISYSILYIFESGRIEDVDLHNSLTDNEYKLITKLIDLNIAHSTDKTTTNYLRLLKGSYRNPN